MLPTRMLDVSYCVNELQILRPATTPIEGKVLV